MITLSKCRQLLGGKCVLSDLEVESLRDQFYALADIATGIFLTGMYLLLFKPFDSLVIEESVALSLVDLTEGGAS